MANRSSFLHIYCVLYQLMPEKHSEDSLGALLYIGAFLYSIPCWKCSHTVPPYSISFVPSLSHSCVSPVRPLICLMYHLFRVSSVPHISFVPRLTLHLIISMSHIFRVSSFRPFPISQLSELVSTSSHPTESIILDKSRNVSNKMYIERTAHPVFRRYL